MQHETNPYTAADIAVGYVRRWGESGLGMHGAIIGSYKTPLGVVFNIAAILMMGFVVFIPSGLLASFFAGWALKSRLHFLCFPAIYVALCVCSIGLVLVDPIGVFEYFYD
jgi:hypothetical protein